MERHHPDIDKKYECINIGCSQSPIKPVLAEPSLRNGHKRMRAIYTCDIGSTRSGNFGWARYVAEEKAIPVGSTAISRLMYCLERDMANRMSIALGLSVPCSLLSLLLKTTCAEGGRVKVADLCLLKRVLPLPPLGSIRPLGYYRRSTPLVKTVCGNRGRTRRTG